MSGDDHVAVGGVVLIDLQLAAGYDEPTETGQYDYLGRVAAFRFAYAREHDALAVGHIERVRRELAARVFLIRRFFHIQMYMRQRRNYYNSVFSVAKISCKSAANIL